MQQKDDVNRLRSSLGTYKTALQVTLQPNTIAILVGETRGQSSSRSQDWIMRENQTHVTMQRVGQRVENIAQAKDQSQTLRRIEKVLVELSSSVNHIVSKQLPTKSFAMEGCTFAADTVATISHLDGVLAMGTKVRAIIKNPFVNPFDAQYITSEPDRQVRETESHLKTACCPVCAESLTETDSSDTQARIQQLQTHWRNEWLSQLKQELHAFNRQDGGLAKTTSQESSDNALLNDAELCDLLSETMSMTSSNDTESQSTPSETRAMVLSRSSMHFSATSEIRQLRTKYESANRCVNILTKEIAAAEEEITSLREAHEQDLNRWRARLSRIQAVPSEQTAMLQQENIELRNSASTAAARISSLEHDNQELLALQQENDRNQGSADITAAQKLRVRRDGGNEDAKLRETPQKTADALLNSNEFRTMMRDKSNTSLASQLFCTHGLRYLQSGQSVHLLNLTIYWYYEHAPIAVFIWPCQAFGSVFHCLRAAPTSGLTLGMKSFYAGRQLIFRDLLAQVFDAVLSGFTNALRFRSKPALSTITLNSKNKASIDLADSVDQRCSKPENSMLARQFRIVQTTSLPPAELVFDLPLWWMPRDIQEWLSAY